MSDVSRRDFLISAEVAAAALVLGGCKHEPADPYELKKPPVPGAGAWYHGQEKWVTSTCGQCPAGCGIRVRVVEGRAVKIEGNREFPLNEGGVGPKGQSGVELLYHPDRVRGPLKRVGPRGSGQFEPVTWDAAVAQIGKTLAELRATGHPEGLVVIDGEPRGFMPELWRRFLAAFGSPNHVDHRSTTDGGKVLAMAYMSGVAELPAYDWPKANYVVGFSSSLYESWCQSMHVTRISSDMRHGTPGRRVKFVQISPRFSVTAAKADEWLAIAPATDGAMALGIASVLVKDGLFDEDFVRLHTFGFENWKDEDGKSHRGFRTALKEDYPVEWAARTTGVPVATITRLAHEMAEHRPSIAIADGAAAAATNGLGTAMAVHSLNALLGSLERPGGMLVQLQPPFAPWKGLAGDGTDKPLAPRLDGSGTAACALGDSFVQGLPEAIMSGKPYPAQALFLYRSNPVYSKPDGKRWIEALGKVPLVVSFSPLRDESTFWADYVLPDHTYLERWEVVEPVPNLGHPVVGMRQPVVVPLHDTMQTGDVLLRLAKAIGGPVAGALPWKDYREAAGERLAGLAGEGEGAGKKLNEAMEKKGGWWTANHPFEKWDEAFPTPSRKFEFYSRIAARLAASFPGEGELEKKLVAGGVTARGDALCMPHWEAPHFAGNADEFPFVLMPYRDGAYAEGGVRHLPLLRELALAGNSGWRDRIDLNPSDAARLNMIEGERVVVESPAGARSLRVNLAPGVRPGTAALPLGYGKWPPAPADAEPAGGLGLLANVSDPLAGILAVQGTRVRIRKA